MHNARQRPGVGIHGQRLPQLSARVVKRVHRQPDQAPGEHHFAADDADGAEAEAEEVEDEEGAARQRILERIGGVTRNPTTRAG